MRLYEYESKEILSGKYNIPVPKGFLVSNISSYDFNEVSFPVVIKAQVLVGGRGKMGGIKFANGPSEAKQIINELLGAEIEGVKVDRLLVEEKVDISKELYLCIWLDRDLATPVIITGQYGGINVEENIKNNVIKVEINPLIGLQQYQVRKVLKNLEPEGILTQQLSIIIYNLYKAFEELDAELVEINPLAVTPQGKFVALDAKIVIDDNSIHRQDNFQGVIRGLTKLEQHLFNLGLRGVEMEGEIGVITSGAGCLMATIDSLKYYGGNVAAAIDLGGSVFNTSQLPRILRECIARIVELKPKVILINAYFQLAKCSNLATAIRESIPVSGGVPIVVRLMGREEDEAVNILSKIPNIFLEKSFDKACRKAVQISRGVNF